MVIKVIHHKDIDKANINPNIMNATNPKTAFVILCISFRGSNAEIGTMNNIMEPKTISHIAKDLLVPSIVVTPATNKFVPENRYVKMTEIVVLFKRWFLPFARRPTFIFLECTPSHPPSSKI